MRASKSLYTPGNNKLWYGRTDAKDHEYFFQIVRFINLNDISDKNIRLLRKLAVETSCAKTRSAEPECTLVHEDSSIESTKQIESTVEFPKKSIVKSGYGLLGFMCDEGVKRNFGRPGAKDGPQVFREVLARMPIHKDIVLYDAGNVICENSDLESAQIELGERVYQLLQLGLQPVVIGGGHETALGHYQGINKYHDDVAILNFDAHFDLRELIDKDKGSSGTPFRQIHNMLKVQNKKFNYYCAGIQPTANTKTLFEYVKNNAVSYLLADDIKRNPYDLSWIENILSKHQHLYVTICLDVFNAATSPGVSAPQPMGIDTTYVIEALKSIKKSQRLVSLDIVELAPCYDVFNCTAKLAASLFFNYCML